ncbi:MAG TPA: alpha/beta fold hydrolase [Terriglobales bacterium]
MRLVLMVAALLATACAQGPSLPGWWLGTLAPAVPLRLEMHVTQASPKLEATFTSLDQGRAQFPASSVAVQGRQVSIAAAAAHATFTGTLSADGNTITGTWSQGPGKLPLTLHREAGPLPVAQNRPQEPKPPFPYRLLPALVPGPGGIHLAGTLTVPPGPGPFPAALLIAGSGPNNRNEDVFGHKIFLVLADNLTRHGFAVLRLDKRGVGQSTGDAATATTTDYAADAAGAFAWLRRQPGIDAARVGLIGHSEGGLIAAMVASQHPEAAFAVMMAGPGERGEDLVVSQVEALNAASGAPPATVAKDATMERAVLDLVMAAPTDAAVPAALDAAATKGTLPKIPAAQVAGLASPWYRAFLRSDPAPYLELLRCPVLALSGSKDVQVPPAANLPLLKADLAHDPHATVVELPGLNHLFQAAKTGLPAEYAQIEETIDPAALSAIDTWLDTVIVPTRAAHR